MLDKVHNRLRRHTRIRSKISGTATKPRVAIYKSNANIYAQAIDDNTGKTLCSVSDVKSNEKETKTESAKKVGTQIAEALKKQKITEIVFDRGGFAFHGRVKALADSAKEAGLNF